MNKTFLSIAFLFVLVFVNLVILLSQKVNIFNSSEWPKAVKMIPPGSDFGSQLKV